MCISAYNLNNKKIPYLEKSLASLARQHAVMLPPGGISANGAHRRPETPVTTRIRGGGCEGGVHVVKVAGERGVLVAMGDYVGVGLRGGDLRSFHSVWVGNLKL